MPTYRIRVTNHTFSACSEHELAQFEDAKVLGMKAALEIGTEEILNGTPFFGAEILVEEGNATRGRFVVSMGASPLQH